ncbi:MAG: glutaminyl-peptide cyclotransferase [Fibrobacter sp.]|jgi:glutamine cyclotransferase|nr:glutaminyl-peptide cyclotransferase [Fibrobacter sp.]
MAISTLLFLAASLQSFVVVDSLPHHPEHFVQGLNLDGKEWIESTGLHGKSALYRKFYHGEILDSIKIDERHFGEGSVLLGNRVFWLTWKSKKAFVLDAKPFRFRKEFKIPSEGWGLSVWNGLLLMSNGTHELYQLSPENLAVLGVIEVKDQGQKIQKLNELEVVGNTLYANIWMSDSIAAIDLKSGQVLYYLDFHDLASALRKKHPQAEVLNGIAYEAPYLWITGKNWPKLYKIKLNP